MVPWVEYINTILSIRDLKISKDEIVIISVPKYISDLDLLLRKTPKRYFRKIIKKTLNIVFSRNL